MGSPATNPRKPSLFLDLLPIELRLSIYSYLLISATPIKGTQARESEKYNIHTTILRLNHQIYAEALPIFLGKNTFCITSIPPTPTADDPDGENGYSAFEPPLQFAHLPLIRHLEVDLLYYPHHALQTVSDPVHGGWVPRCRGAERYVTSLSYLLNDVKELKTLKICADTRRYEECDDWEEEDVEGLSGGDCGRHEDEVDDDEMEDSNEDNDSDEDSNTDTEYNDNEHEEYENDGDEDEENEDNTNQNDTNNENIEATTDTDSEYDITAEPLSIQKYLTGFHTFDTTPYFHSALANLCLAHLSLRFDFPETHFDFVFSKDELLGRSLVMLAGQVLVARSEIRLKALMKELGDNGRDVDGECVGDEKGLKAGRNVTLDWPYRGVVRI